MKPWTPVVIALSLFSCAGPHVYYPSPKENFHLTPALQEGYATNPLAGFKSAQGRGAHQNAKCSLAIAISGGGSIAASVAFGVFERLSEELASADGRDFLNEVDYYSTASGGGIAAALAVDMMREYAVRNPADPIPGKGKLLPYLASGRFRGALSDKILTDMHFAFGAVGGGTPSIVYNQLEGTLTGKSSLGLCTPEDLSSPRTKNDRTGCLLEKVGVLKFDDFLIPADSPKPPPLPIWLANITLYDTGTNLPAYPAMLQSLKIDRIQFFDRLVGSAFVDVDKLDTHHALTLSMAFPGIGPVLAKTASVKDTTTARRDEQGTHIYLSDGGQSDNLGLLTAVSLVASDIKNGESSRGLVIVIDASSVPENPWVWGSTGPGERLAHSVFNGVPLLSAARYRAPGIAASIAHDLLKDRASSVETVFVRTSDVMNDPAITLPFAQIPEGHCTRSNGDPMDRDDCLRGVETKQETPMERLGDKGATLALSRVDAEAFILLGRAAADRELSRIRSAVQQCLAAQ